MPTNHDQSTYDDDLDDLGRQTVLEAHGYRIMRSLGHGSYATVKLAYSERHQTNVAIKIISKKRAPKDYIEKFLPREITIVKMLKHPNLVVFLQVTLPFHSLAPPPLSEGAQIRRVYKHTEDYLYQIDFY